jgi:DNA modification methylase
VIRILEGDCLAVLPTLEAGSVQTCVTSPPYFGLRDYGTGKWEGGEPGCGHIAPKTAEARDAGRDRAASGGTFHDSPVPKQIEKQFASVCGHCGARRIDQQIGLESTPEEYIAKMVAVFREVWWVLRDNGTLWLQMGDSYSQVGSARGQPYQRHAPVRSQGWEGTRLAKREIGRNPVTPKLNGDLKPKDLCMMPARVAMALQADGWYLRSDIIWHKPNPMPESVTDRPTTSHEHIFLLAKNERYFYDAEAIREQTGNEMKWDEYARKTAPGATWPSGGITRYAGTFKKDGGQSHPNGRNKRSVWTIATQPMSDYGYDFAAADYVDAHGIPRKWSADCPMHERDGQPRRENLAMVSCDAPVVISHYDSGRIDVRPEIKLPAVDDPKPYYKNYPAEDSFSCAQPDDISENKRSDDLDVAERERQFHTKRIQSLPVPSMTDSGHLSCARTAILHNNGDRKNDRDARKLGGDNVSEQLEFRIEYMEPPLYVTGRDESTGGNNTKPCNDHQKSTVEIVSHRNDKSSRNEGKCLCSISQVSHFATFPEDLIKPCILAGSRPGDIVLDPFAGTGTTGAVALELGRMAILIELNPDYVKLISERTNVTPGFPNLDEGRSPRRPGVYVDLGQA